MCAKSLEMSFMFQSKHSILRQGRGLSISGGRCRGPLPLAMGQRKFILVAIDYFTKWVEAEDYAQVTTTKLIQFVKKNIVCRFGVPHSLVSDNGL